MSVSVSCVLCVGALCRHHCHLMRERLAGCRGFATHATSVLHSLTRPRLSCHNGSSRGALPCLPSSSAQPVPALPPAVLGREGLGCGLGRLHLCLTCGSSASAFECRAERGARRRADCTRGLAGWRAERTERLGVGVEAARFKGLDRPQVSSGLSHKQWHTCIHIVSWGGSARLLGLRRANKD